MTEPSPSELPAFSHPAPVKLLYIVFFTLVAMTVLTVWANGLNLHGMDIWVALTIATFKASLVVLFFMHMWWDKGLNRLLFLASFVFVTLFIGLTLMDKQNYQDSVRNYPVINRPAPPEPYPSRE